MSWIVCLLFNSHSFKTAVFVIQHADTFWDYYTSCRLVLVSVLHVSVTVQRDKMKIERLKRSHDNKMK